MIKEKNLPNGWAIKPMTEVVTWGAGGTPKATESQYYDNGDIPWLIIGDLNDGVVTESQSKITELGLKNSSAKIIPAGTLLVAMYGSIGKLGITGIECCTNQAIAFAKELRGVSTKYMFYYMAMMKSKLISMGKGGTQNNISQTILKSLNVIVPPPEVQDNLVFRIEELFSELDKAVEALQTTKQQLAVYRQAVLKEAFCEIPFSEYRPLREIMQNSPQNGLYKPKSDYGSGVRILRIDGFYNGFISPTYDFKRLHVSQEEINRYSLKVNDLVVNRVNSMPYLGKCALVRKLDETTVFESNMMRFRLNDEKANPKYVTYYLSSLLGKKELTKNAKQAVNQASINQTDVGNALIPVPIDILHQKKVVEIIESRLSVCESIEQTVETTLAQADAMRQSILKQAFEGGFNQ